MLPGYILQGVVDLIEWHGETVEIIDFKTGTKPDVTKYSVIVEHYRKQLEIYAYLVEKKYGKKVSRMHLYYTSVLEGDPLITFECKESDIDQTINEITRTVEKIETKDFCSQVQNKYACTFCDMRHFCGCEDN